MAGELLIIVQNLQKLTSAKELDQAAISESKRNFFALLNDPLILEAEKSAGFPTLQYIINTNEEKFIQLATRLVSKYSINQQAELESAGFSKELIAQFQTYIAPVTGYKSSILQGEHELLDAIKADDKFAVKQLLQKQYIRDAERTNNFPALRFIVGSFDLNNLPHELSAKDFRLIRFAGEIDLALRGQDETKSLIPGDLLTQVNNLRTLTDVTTIAMKDGKLSVEPKTPPTAKLVTAYKMQVAQLQAENQVPRIEDDGPGPKPETFLKRMTRKFACG